MKERDDFLVELLTEELPPKTLSSLGRAFCQKIEEQLQKAGLAYDEAKWFATPRRLAVLVKALQAHQPDQLVERRGPALKAAFTADGEPTPACVGFARSLGITPKELVTLKTPQGEWVGYHQHVAGKTVAELLPAMVESAAVALPVSKRMRWGDGETQFARPILSVMMLYGEAVVEGSVLGFPAGRITRGHRFHAPFDVTVLNAADYEALLQEAYVMADVEKRRAAILEKAKHCLAQLGPAYGVSPSEALLDEVVGLVEWPVALCGQFDATYLALPPEVPVSAMQDHQRYFPVFKNNELQPYFITMSNIESHDVRRVTHGNERVLRARLSDAAFFYEIDQKEKLGDRLERLKGIVYQAQLGTLYEKAQRLSQLTNFIYCSEASERAGLLAKTDLTTQMVGEFPELQGLMGAYYAKHDGESVEVALAMKEHYLPRFADDALPTHAVSQALAIADRMDILVGAFGINQLPTGDKDPYGLRRAALGIIRICLMPTVHVDIDLEKVIRHSVGLYGDKLKNPDVVPALLTFIQERLRSYYQEKGVAADVFAAVVALGIAHLRDVDKRIQAVQTFKRLPEAEALATANKRVSNILSKYADPLQATAVNAQYFEHTAEQALEQALNAKRQEIKAALGEQDYESVLLQLAKLRQPIDDFFDHVMVMAEDQARRENRILLLQQVRQLFTQVADIALLQ